MPRKPPSNRFEPSASLRLTHQPKLSSSLVKTRTRNSWSRRPSMPIDLPRRPRVHRRVDVTERPLVRGQLAVRMHRPLAAQQQQLLLRRSRVDVRERARSGRRGPTRRTTGTPTRRACEMHVGEREVRHAALRRPRCGASPAAAGLAGSPSSHSRDAVAVELLAPQQPGERAPGDRRVLVVQVGGQHGGVELVGLVARGRRSTASKPAPKVCSSGSCGDSRSRTRTVSPGAHRVELVPERRLGAGAVGVHRRLVAVRRPGC